MPITRQEPAILKTIAAVSPRLVAFVLALRISLSRPQQQHVIQVVDALITTEASKTLSGLYRHIVGDPSLSAQAALPWFLHRWLGAAYEVANWYIKERLGWADCRLWRVESSEKFLMVLWLALAYLEYRKAKEFPRKSLADIIWLHRNAHARRLLEEACHMVLQVGSIADVLARFTLTPAT